MFSPDRSSLPAVIGVEPTVSSDGDSSESSSGCCSPLHSSAATRVMTSGGAESAGSVHELRVLRFHGMAWTRGAQAPTPLTRVDHLDYYLTLDLTLVKKNEQRRESASVFDRFIIRTKVHI